MNIWMAFHGYSWDVDTLGERGSLAFIGPEWAAALSSPGRLFKFYDRRGRPARAVRRRRARASPRRGRSRCARPSSPTCTPTILDFAGVAPTSATAEIAMTGRSLRPVLERRRRRARIPSTRRSASRSRATRRSSRATTKLVRNMPPYGDGGWHLYDVAHDPGETRDLSTAEPERFAELLRDYDAYTQRDGRAAAAGGLRRPPPDRASTRSCASSDSTGGCWRPWPPGSPSRR